GVAFHNQQQLGAKRGTKFDYLLAQGLRSQDDVNAAIAAARHKNTDVEAVLLDQYRIPKGELGTSRSQFYRVPSVYVSERIIPPANQVIVDAFKARASDIHIEPYGAAKDTMIRLRIDGGCNEYQRVPGAFRRALVARIKIMAMLDIAERRKPQDGKIKFRMPDGRDIELRVATLPTQGGNEDVVMRILSASEPIPIDKLGMLDRNLR